MYENVKIKIEERISKKTGKPYIAVVAIIKGQEILIGFDKLAKDIVFKCGR